MDKFPPSLNTELTEDEHLAYLLNVLNKVSHRCYDFGLQLGLKNYEINTIKYDDIFPQLQDKLREILSKRLKQEPPLTLSIILLALRTPCVDMGDVASSIEYRFSKISIQIRQKSFSLLSECEESHPNIINPREGLSENPHPHYLEHVTPKPNHPSATPQEHQKNYPQPFLEDPQQRPRLKQQCPPSIHAHPPLKRPCLRSHHPHFSPEHPHPPLEHPHPPLEPTGPPLDHTHSRLEHPDPPLEDTFPPFDHSHSPLEHPDSPLEHTRSPLEHTRSPLEHPDSPLEHTRSPLEHTRSPLEDTRSPLEHPDSPLERTRSPLEHTRSPLEDTLPPLEYTGPALEHTRRPLKRPYLPFEHHPFEHHPLKHSLPHLELIRHPIGHTHPPLERTGPPSKRPFLPSEHPHPLSKHSSPPLEPPHLPTDDSRKSDLDSQYWLPILQQNFGIQSVSDLKSLGSKYYYYCYQFCNNSEEIGALQKSIGLKYTNYESHREEQKRCLSIRVETLSKVFAGKKPAQTSRSQSQNVLKTICDCFQVPIKFLPSKSKLAQLHNLKEYPRIMKQQLNIPELTAMEVLKKASDSLALRGVFLSGNISDQIKPREVMLDPTTCGVLMKPTFPKFELNKCFGSRIEEEQYFNIMSKLGLSLTFSIDFFFPGVVFELASGDQHVVTVSQQQKKISKDYSICKSFFVPLASVLFSTGQVKLSNDAIDKLKEIDSLIEEWDKNVDLIQSKTREFFEMFGSHFNKGPIHLGGVQYWVANCSIRGKGGLATAVKDSVLKCDSQHATTRTISNHANPARQHCLALWKDKLVANNANWVVIDRGVTFIPIWDILVNHTNDFKKPFSLATIMEHQWNLINGNYPVRKLELVSKYEEAKHLAAIVVKWNLYSDISSYEQELRKVLQIKMTISKASMNPELWPKYFLSQPAVQKYLNEIAKKRCSKKDRQIVGSLLQKIIEPHEFPFVNKLNIYRDFLQNVYNTECSTPQVNGASLKVLLRYFEFALVYMQDFPQHNPSNVLCTAGRTEVSIQITVSLSKVVNFVLHHLKVSLLKFEEYFIIAILLPLGYDLIQGVFLTTLTTCDILLVKNIISNEYKYFFQTLESKNIFKLQEYLLYLYSHSHSELCKFPSLTSGELLKLFGLENGNTENVLSKRRNASECNDATTTVWSNIQSFFSLLGLSDFFPQRLTLTYALQLRDDTLESIKSSTSNDEIQINPSMYPFIILQNILSFNYKCKRPLLFDSKADCPEIFSFFKQDVDEDQCGVECEVDKDDKYKYVVHPMDGLLALLYCADNFLRQDLMCRLANCQIAVPLLLPDPLTKTPKLLIWALRSIVKEWKNLNTGQEIEHQLVSYPIPLVSFMRIGKHKTSKSGIMNGVILDKQEIFTTVGSAGGDAKKLLVDGLVEICWYLPSEKKTSFKNILSFVNLHGDARYCANQVHFLCELSFINFVLVKPSDIKDSDKNIFHRLAKAPGRLVLLLTEHTKRQHPFMEILFPKKEVRDNVSVINIGLNDYKNKNNIQSEIKKCLQDKDNFQPIEAYSTTAHDCGFDVDEDDENLKKGKDLSDHFQSIVKEYRSNPAQSLQSLCPLQSPEIWGQWAAHDKEQYRQKQRKKDDNIENYGPEQRKIMRTIRRKQLDKFVHQHPLMLYFTSSLTRQSGDIRTYFLSFLKIILDNISRELLPPLRRKYETLRQNDTSSQADKELLELKKNIVRASFGLEHLLREFCQVYEAHNQSSHGAVYLNPSESDFSYYAQVGAELLADGNTLEIMDGDAAHIPIAWIKAVFTRLQENLPNSKFLVLSVLGVQSSGKSTLLNTVFGLQFTTSAGRCTRGAFMKLLPVHSCLREKVNCDYFLIIDTEGLKAPELQSRNSISYDNALATFCIGVANLTIINLNGEITTLDDVLQTTFFAFIRMREVHLKVGCHFVHHNSTAIMSKAKNVVGRDLFENNLDRITNLAAKEQWRGALPLRFNDVIKFKYEKDVTYFSNLVDGEPPMSRVSWGYSYDALQLKHHIISSKTEEEMSRPRDLTDFTNHVGKLWEAICKENFIFSFKNTVEIVTYNALQREYSQWSWNLKHTMIQWGQRAENRLMNCEMAQLDNDYSVLICQLPTDIEKAFNEAERKRKEYFNQNSEKEVVKQWEFETMRRLRATKYDLKKNAEDHCKRIKASRKSLSSAEQKGKEYTTKLVEDVRSFATKLKGETMSEEDLHKRFNDKWTELIQEQKGSLDDPEIIDVKQHVQECLLEFGLLKPHHTIIIDELQVSPLEQRTSDPGKESCVSLDVTPSYIDQNIFLIRKSLQSFIGNSRYEYTLRNLEIMNERLCSKMTRYLDDNIKQWSYHREITTLVLNHLFDEIEAEEKDTVITPHYRVHLAIAVCRYALIKYKEIVEEERKKSDPIEYLEHEVRQPLYNLFCDEYHEVEKEVTAAVELCRLLGTSIKLQVQKSLGPKIVTVMKGIGPCLQTKPSLKAQILLDIGEILHKSDKPTDVYHCFQYLTNVEASIRYWISQYCKQVLNEEIVNTVCGKQVMQPRFTVLMIEELSSLKENVNDCIRMTKGDECSEYGKFVISKWLHSFHSAIVQGGRLQLSAEKLNEFVGVHDIKHGVFFMEQVHVKLSVIVFNLQEECLLELKKNIMDNAEYLLFEELAGCTVQCPFCKEQCDSNYSGHYNPNISSTVHKKHSVKYHRPQCLGGYRYLDTGIMTLNICTTDVASTENTFLNAATDQKIHRYSEYAKIYPEWCIPDDMGADVSLYWKWIVGHYSDQMVEYYKMKPSEEVPEEWKELMWNDVSKQLKEDFHL